MDFTEDIVDMDVPDMRQIILDNARVLLPIVNPAYVPNTQDPPCYIALSASVQGVLAHVTCFDRDFDSTSYTPLFWSDKESDAKRAMEHLLVISMLLVHHFVLNKTLTPVEFLALIENTSHRFGELRTGGRWA